jgi:hypothetical protein
MTTARPCVQGRSHRGGRMPPMARAALRPCATPGCGTLVARGHCAAHGGNPATRDGRGTATARGYGAAWARFRLEFVGALVAAGIAPTCGAALPGGPRMGASRCRAAGVWTGVGLHLHHDPPLLEAERRDRAAVCNAWRVGFLCAACHNLETARAAIESRR